MTIMSQSTAAWRELLETLGGLDASFLDGERAVTDDRHIADGYRMLATTLGVAFDTYLFPDPSRPRWVELNSPSRQDRRWGGDNTDAYYFMCPVDPKRRYRISGNKNDSVYFSVTAYNEPSPGAWSDRVVAILRDDDLDIDAEGNFSFELGPTPDAAVLMTRDYQADPQTGRPVSWHIEALDEPDPFRHGDEETAAALRASAAWMRTMFAILPLAVGARVEDAHTLGHEISPGRKRIRRSLSGARLELRVVGARRVLCLRQLRARGRRGTCHHPSAAEMPVLESGGVEPVHGDPRRRRRSKLGQRSQRRAERRRIGHGRSLARHDGASQFDYDAGISAGQSRVPVVSRRRGARAARGSVGQSGRRADDRQLTQAFMRRATARVPSRWTTPASSARCRAARG